MRQIFNSRPQNIHSWTGNWNLHFLCNCGEKNTVHSVDNNRITYFGFCT